MTRHRNRLTLVVAVNAALVLCAILVPPTRLTRAQAAQSVDETGPARPPAVVPGPAAGPKRLSPHPLADVASIVEADVAKVTTAFDATLGPRLVVELTNVVVHAGAPLPETTFSQLGGPMPDGRYVEVKELPEFTAGARYILFLSKQASIYTPVWARLAFRIEQLSTKAIVLGPDGEFVLHLGTDGVRFGKTKLIADNHDRATPLAAHVFDKSAAESDADVASAMSPQEFIAAAKQAASAVGAPFGAPISLRPSANARWHATPTSPQ
jgi:hypothetical protein